MTASIAPPPAPAGITPEHWAELVIGSGIDPEVAAANVRSFGPGATEHWEDARAALIAHKRLAIQTGSTTTAKGLPQAQPGFVADRLIALQQQYRHLAHGGWRSSTAGLPGFEPFDCFKPNDPRLGSDRRLDKRTGLIVPVMPKPIKYESPPGHPRGGGVFAPVVPLPQWDAIARRAGLPEPDAAAIAGGFWPWLLAHPQVPIVVAEGLKKCLSVLSCGHACVGLSGIDMGARRNDDDVVVLVPELLALAQADRPMVVVFDRETKPSTAARVAAAAARLRWLLRTAGAAACVAELPELPGASKVGADDLVVALGPEALDKVVVAALAAPAIAPAVPRLRAADAEAPADRYLAEALAIPTDRRLIALAAGMGTGKTELLAQALRPLQLAGVRVVLISHRRSLAAALADRLGLPWGDDAAPGSDLRQCGIALCIDSLCRQSAVRFNAAEWRGSIVLIDEAAAVLRHALHGRGTAIARRRPEVLDSLGQLLAGASQVLVADAQLDDDVLQALEAAVGARAHLIGSKRLPAAGRELVTHPTRESWRSALLGFLQRRERVWIATTAAEADSPNSAVNLAQLAAATWPDCRVLQVDRDTVADPEHDACRLAADPDRVVAGYDVVVASPAVAAGLSVTIRGHFAAVLGIAGGTTPAADVAQALSRLRDEAPRHLYAPSRSPGNAMQIGCGSLNPRVVLRHLDRHAQAAVAAALAAGWDADTDTTGPWLRLWAAQAAQQNRSRMSFAATVLALLEREGYRAVEAQALDGIAAAEAKVAGAQLRDLAAAAAAEAQAAIVAAPVLTDAEAAELQGRRRRLSPAERAQLQRWRVDRAWALQGAAPSPELLEAHDDGAHRKAVSRWAVTDPAADRVVARHDRELAKQLAPMGRAWAPDLADGLLGPKVTAMRALGLPGWLQRGDWFGADDPALQLLVPENQQTAADRADGIAQVLGLRPGKRPITALRQLLALVGARLEVDRRRQGGGRSAAAAYRYRVMLDRLPDGVTDDRVVAAWVERVGCVPKSALQKAGTIPVHTHG
ncbi:MAG: hypothetical protein RLZZ468_2008 [Cyanobacteriota bacterium]|jgi:hypothetical protein